MAGARVRLGDGADVGHLTSRDPRQAHLDGFDLHANARVPPPNRARLEQLSAALSSAPARPGPPPVPTGAVNLLLYHGVLASRDSR